MPYYHEFSIGHHRHFSTIGKDDRYARKLLARYLGIFGVPKGDYWIRIRRTAMVGCVVPVERTKVESFYSTYAQDFIDWMR